MLPANLEWGASVPNPAAGSVRISNAAGIVCWEQQVRGSQGCNGSSGNGTAPISGQGFLAPDRAPGALITKTHNGRQYFSVNDRGGDAFHYNEGYFPFDVDISGPR